ncbi:hypothetical protein KM043_003265 [Ampulex compressa]|nr:hypothetical protein KM043_003265 [Ampulex compressa]
MGWEGSSTPYRQSNYRLAANPLDSSNPFCHRTLALSDFIRGLSTLRRTRKRDLPEMNSASSAGSAEAPLKNTLFAAWRKIPADKAINLSRKSRRQSSSVPSEGRARV